MISSDPVYDEKAFGFWLYLMSDGDDLRAAVRDLCGDGAQLRPAAPPARICSTSRHTFAETMVLLVSSITFGFASIAIRQGVRHVALSWLAVTFVLGAGFVAMEISEFSGLVAQGAGPQRSGFLSAFFTLVGTHGLHVTMGLIWIVILSLQVLVKGLTAPVASRLFRLGLFWHFLDIVWIGIFSIVYLPGML